MSHRKPSFTFRLYNFLASMLIPLVGMLPLRANRAFGAFLGWLLSVFPNDYRYATRVNLAFCFPELSAAARKKMERRSLIEDARTILDMTYVWQHPHKALARVRHIEGADKLAEAMHSGRPVAVLAPHIGSWELMNLWISSLYDMHILYKPSGLPALDNIVRRSRETFRTTAYPITKEGMAEFHAALQQGNVITGVLPDQVAVRGRGIFVDFFGRPAYTSPFACRLIQKHNAITFVVGAIRQNSDNGPVYDLAITPISDAIYQDDLTVSLTAMNGDMEAFIQRAPEQYLWSYRRFRRRPDNSPNPYKKVSKR